jgi:hypothetical protein
MEAAHHLMMRISLSQRRSVCTTARVETVSVSYFSRVRCVGHVACMRRNKKAYKY